MNQFVCKCGHERRDHVRPAGPHSEYSTCKVCLCDRYERKEEPAAAKPKPPEAPEASSFLIR